MTRANPTHWIWQQTFPKRFDPDETAYLVMRQLCQDTGHSELVSHMEDFIEEGMSAEQMVALFGLDATMPPLVVRAFGNGIAYWVQRYREDAQ